LRGRYISKEERIRLKEKDDRAKEVLRKHGIEIVDIVDTHQHRYTTLTFRKGNRVEKFMFENNERNWSQLKPTPIGVQVISLLFTADFIENFVRGMNIVKVGAVPRGIYLTRLEEFLERVESIFGNREQRWALALELKEAIK